ncbi:Transmembrane protein 94 [Bulinus truncatus]|nr:Transmembrane protein 94 [Bulinus truncatus]
MDRTMDKTTGRTQDRTMDKTTGRTQDRTMDKTTGRTQDRTMDKTTGRTQDRTMDKTTGRTQDRTMDNTTGRTQYRTMDKTTGRTQDRTMDKTTGRTHDRTMDKTTGMCQLLTQGTGDLVLDCCTDAWNGTDLQTLSEIDRKRVLDFYHRNSMVAYCTAFAYKPLPKCIEDWSSDVYTELMESPSTTKEAHGEDAGVFLDGEDEVARHQRSHSMDSLLEISPSSSMEELGIGQMIQSHQTFIGMVSLQYQARQDFVQLIDKLESACIRFVHFSKENEVRSRVFAEKMGLEAGWNCHVSLMAAESLGSESSSSRNLSCLGPSQPANTNGGVQGLGSNPVCIARPKETASSLINSYNSVSRTWSAPSFVNTQEVQVKFAKDTLPILLDDSVKEDCILLTDVGTSVCANSVAQILFPDSSNQNKSDRNSESESEEEKQPLVPRKTHKSWIESEYDDDEDEEEDFDIQSDSRYTSSYVTENTEDSLTGALDNRVTYFNDHTLNETK